MTEKATAQALRDALDAAMDPWQTFDPDDLPTSALPRMYGVLWLSRRYGGVQRQGKPGAVGWRVLVRTVGSSVDEVRHLNDQISTLEGEQIAVPGRESSPLTFESSDPVGPDDGLFSAAVIWTFATWPST